MKNFAYQVDAFAGKGFSGNPAMVCPLERWLNDEALQHIARKNDFPVTAFLVRSGGEYELRWFTSTVELDLCGHGTIASGRIVFDFLEEARESVTFRTKGGDFQVIKEDPLVRMDFPLLDAIPCSTIPQNLVLALGREPQEVLTAKNYLVAFRDEAEIRAIDPDLELLKDLDGLGVIVTARGKHSDFVSRYFAPKIGIPEDIATGSTHCTLAPYWSGKLGWRKLHSLQLSKPSGELWCESLEDKVRISAQAMLRSKSSLQI